MEFSLTEDQLRWKRAATQFANKELRAGLVDRDSDGAFSSENWLKCADFGILGLPVPETYGGSGSDLLTTALVMEGLGRGCGDNGLIFALNAQMWSVQAPILSFGSDEQKSRFIPELISGRLIGAHGMSEPDSGSDAYSLRTRAERVAGGYVLNGLKTFVTNAPQADLAVIFATLDPAKRLGGITAFLVERGMPGLEFGRSLEKMGLRTAPMGEVVLQDCFVPEANRLGPEGGGASLFNASMGWERSCILASHVGAMERQLQTCVDYARERVQFGRPIGGFQAVANRIADMKVRLETSRLLLYQVVWLSAAGKPTVMEAAMAKLYLSECFVASSLDAVRVHGGYGYMTEFEVERDLRDSIGGTIYSGTSDIQRVLIARWLGLPADKSA